MRSSWSFLVRAFALLAGLAVVLAGSSVARSQPITYRWQMVATEDQVNNYAGSPDGSTDSPATADVSIEYTASTGLLQYEMTWRDLQWPLTKIHLHGPARPDQSVMPHLWNVFTKEEDVLASGVDRTNDTWVDTVRLVDIVPGPPYLVTSGILQAMVDELGYMNFHTFGFPMGETRGNLILVEENVPVTAAHRSCVDRMQRVRERATRAWQRHVRRCFADPESAGAGSSMEDCLTTDSRETATLAGKIEDAYQTSCWGFDGAGYLRFPAFGGGRQDAIASAAQTHMAGLVEDLFGVGTAMATSDPNVAACQRSVLGAANSCLDVIQREFRRCTRPGFRGSRGPAGADLPFDDPQDMALCLGEDGAGRIARKCDRSVGRADPIRRNLAARCTKPGVDLASAFPGCAAPGTAESEACVIAAARCRACLTIHGTIDDSALECETFDDGLDNGSCGP